MNIVLPLDKIGPLKVALSEYSDDMPLSMMAPAGWPAVQAETAEMALVGGVLYVTLSDKHYPTSDETVAALNRELVEDAPVA
jgi:hypothetical protein